MNALNAHGYHSSITWVGNILYTRLEGIFNKGGCEAYVESVLMETAGKTHTARIVDLRKCEGFTPDCFESFRRLSNFDLAASTIASVHIYNPESFILSSFFLNKLPQNGHVKIVYSVGEAFEYVKSLGVPVAFDYAFLN